MTLQDFKDQVAREAKIPPYAPNGFKNWDHLIRGVKNSDITIADMDYESDRAAELYAKEREKEASPKWIPVTESLPEVEEGYNSYSVLIYTEETYTWTGYYNHWKNQWFSGTEKVIVTHWMKIPERP